MAILKMRRRSAETPKEKRQAVLTALLSGLLSGGVHAPNA
jgi:hypothetical protein